MLIYFLIPLYLFILSLINPKNKIIKDISFIITGIFLCTTYFNGSDWKAYELMYNVATIKDISSFYAEKGFYIWMLLFKLFNFDFWTFFIITKLLVFYIFYLNMKDIENPYLCLNFFYFQMGLFLLIDCPLRNLIAIAITLIAINFLTKNKKIKFIFLILLASTFHNSAILFIFLIFYKKLYKFSKKQLWIGIVILFLILSNRDLFNKILFSLPMFKERIEIYINSEYGKGRLFSFGILKKLFFLTLMLLNKDKTKGGKDLYIFFSLYILLYRIAMNFSILGRTAFYLQLFYILGINRVLQVKRRSIRCIIISIIFIFEISYIYKVIVPVYKYIPYTSYLSYIYKKKPLFKYRSEYNYYEYIKRRGKDEYIKKYLNK